MNNSSRHENIFYILLVYFFLIITIIQANSVYMYTMGLFHISKFVITILWIGTLFVLFIYSFNKLEKRIDVNLMVFIGILLLTSVILIGYNLLFKSSFGLYIPQIVIASILLMLYFYSIGEHNISILFKRFENIILVLSGLSLISWIMFLVHVPTTLNLMSLWGNKNDPRLEMSYFGTSFFTNKSAKFLGMNWVSNNGIFAEPSMFAYILLIALLIELFIKKDSHILNWKILLLLVTIISTDSTTGILLAIPTIIYHALVINNRDEIFKYILLGITPFIIIFLRIVLEDKMNEGSDVLSSFNIRLDDIISGFKTWMEYPLMGCGLTNFSPIRDNMNPLRITPTNPYPGSSSGLFVVLAQGGFYLGLYYLLPSFLVIKKHLAGISVPLIIAFMFTSSQEFYSYIMILMYFWYLVLKNK